MQTESNSVGTGANGKGDGSAASAISTAAEALTLAGAELEQAKEKLLDRVVSMKQSVQNMGGAVAHHTRKTVTATDGYVHGNPWAAVGIGAASGFVLGVLLARRAKREN